MNPSEKMPYDEYAKCFAAIFSSNDIGVIIKDQDDRIIDCNAGAQQIMGYTLGELSGYTSEIYTYEYQTEELARIFQSISAGESCSQIAVDIKHKDGHRIICEVSYFPLFDDAGSVSGAVIILRDITEERTAAEQVASLAAIISNADAGIILQDNEGVIRDWNVGARNIMGYDREEAVGKTTKMFSTLQGYSQIDDILRRLRQGEHIAHVEVVRRHKDGRLIDCSASYTPTYDSRGVNGSFSIFHDITKQKQVERKHRRAEENLAKAYRDAAKAQQASRMKSNFLANMSHEIRTPLNGVIGFAELALDDPALTGKTREYLNMINISANGLLEIINDILDISKIEAGKMELAKTPFTLPDVFKHCKNINEQKAQEKRIDLYFYFEPLPGKILVGDPTKLRQILLNLLSNAIKFTSSGAVTLMSAVKEIKDNSVSMYFEVKDSGIGMTEEQIDKIYMPFAQADSNISRKYGGTGLGLSITKNLLELMRGELAVVSKPGFGSKFSFMLEFETIEVGEVSGVHTEQMPVNMVKPIFSGEVLVCEDNEINQLVIKEHLAKIGLQVTIADNGKEGVKLAKEKQQEDNSFDIIFMDIHMPVMDGIEATKRLKEMGVTTPIVALTANVMAREREHYLQSGMVDYVSKPFIARELWSCLLKLLTPAGGTFNEEPAALGELHSAGKGEAVINRELGLTRAANNEGLYQRLQMNFYKNGKSIYKEIEEAVAAGDWKLAHRKVHSLKSVAGTIGAVQLQEAAAEAEQQAGKEEMDPGQLENLRRLIDEVLAELSFPEPEPGSKSPEDQRFLQLDQNQVRELLEKLEPLLAAGNSRSQEYIEEILEMLSPLGADCDILVTNIEEFDFDLAYQRLLEIKQLIGSR